jgi:hypothetical protein
MLAGLRALFALLKGLPADFPAPLSALPGRRPRGQAGMAASGMLSPSPSAVALQDMGDGR